MNAKEIKSLLKQAKEAIKDKEYKIVLKHCKVILKSEKNNYNAWVFVGIAAQETDQPEQSEAAFQKAIDISPDQILAWQGLCNFYEKQENKDKLINAFIKLVKLLDNDKNKQSEILNKLISLVKATDNKEKIAEVLELQLETVTGDTEKEYLIWKDIFRELLNEKKLNSHLETLQHTAFFKIVEHPEFSEDDCKRIIQTYIEPLYRDKQTAKAIELTQQINNKYPDSRSCLEFLSKAVLDVYIKTGTIMEGMKQRLLTMKDSDVSLWLYHLVRGLLSFNNKNYLHAIQEFKTGVEKKDNSLEGWYLLAKVQLLLHLYPDAEKSSKTGLRIGVNSNESSDVIGHFYLFLGEALAGRRIWDAALKAFEKCVEHMGRTSEILIAFCLTLLKIGQSDKSEKICTELYADIGQNAQVLQLEGYTLILKKHYPEALQKLRQSLSLEESSFTLHLIGIVLWETEQKEKSFKIFVKAAELDPFFSKNFLYLGHYYMNHESNKRKACQCYQKAFELDNTDEEAGMCLSNVLKGLGDDDANLSVLKIVTAQAALGSCKWAWTQLGLYQLERGDPFEAILSLQNAVRADPSSSYGWECLGDAYLKRGSYESALKAFDKAAELNPKAMYPLYQVSTILKMRGLYVDAAEKYKNLLVLEPVYVPALIGLAETLLLLGRNLFCECIFGRARDSFQEAINVLARVVPTNTGLSCLWKLAGDACTLPFHLGDEWFPISVPSELHMGPQSETTICQKKELLMLGAKFYGRALSLKGSLGALWHDLGINTYFQSIVADHSERPDLARKALLCVQKAVSVSSTQHNHWTTLGIIAASEEIHDYAIAQHAFIKSIKIERNNAEAWTNLGILYLEEKNIELAHNAFKISQSLEPTYPLCWIGQAVIADTIKHSDTMDLFRHATTLGSHTEALLGYGRTVCLALLDKTNRETELYRYNIEQMDAVVVASDCIIKYTANNENCPEAFNILGMLLERQGVHNGALNAYRRAVEIFEKFGKTDEVEKVRTNLARSLCATSQVEEAILEYLKLKAIDTSLLCSFAFTLYKGKKFDKAFDVFKRALKISTLTSEKSHILVAMAMVALNMQGPEAPNALSLLFESSQTKPPSILGLLALCAVGIMKNEASLAAAAQKELLSFRHDPEYGPSVALLSAAHSYMKNGPTSARNQLLKAVHCHPNNCAMWMQTASCLLQWDPEYANVAATCSQVAIFHGGNKEMASQIFALCRLSAGYRKVALYASQKAVHIHPEKLSNWTTLAAACHVAGKDRKHIGWIFSFVKKLAKQQGIKSNLLGWLVVMEVFHYIYCQDMTSAGILINQALSASSFNSSTQSVLQILNALISVISEKGKLDALVVAMKNNSGRFLGWHILMQLLMGSRKFNEAEKTLAQFQLAATKLFPKWQTFPLLQLTALSYEASKINENEKEKWLKIGEGAVGEAVKLSQSNQAARFLQGLIAIESGNTSLARRSLERVLYYPVVKESKWMERAAQQLLIPMYFKKKDQDALQRLVNQFPENDEAKELMMDLVSTKE